MQTAASATGAALGPQAISRQLLRELCSLAYSDNVKPLKGKTITAFKEELSALQQAHPNVNIEHVIEDWSLGLGGHTTSGEVPNPIPEFIRIYRVTTAPSVIFTVITFRGTSSSIDIVTDILLCHPSGRTPRRFSHVARWLHWFIAKELKNGNQVVLTGHSLGAADAQFHGIMCGVPSVGFDSPGCRRIIDEALKARDGQSSSPGELSGNHLTVNNCSNFVNCVAAFTGGVHGEVVVDPDTDPVTHHVLDAVVFLTSLAIMSLMFYFITPPAGMWWVPVALAVIPALGLTYYAHRIDTTPLLQLSGPFFEGLARMLPGSLHSWLLIVILVIMVLIHLALATMKTGGAGRAGGVHPGKKDVETTLNEWWEQLLHIEGLIFPKDNLDAFPVPQPIMPATSSTTSPSLPSSTNGGHGGSSQNRESESTKEEA